MMSEKNIFFQFESFDLEIRKKFISLEMSIQDLTERLLEKLKQENLCSKSDFDKTETLIHFLEKFSLDEVYRNYLSHPIRVAGSFASVLGKISYDDLSLALCHNMIETGYAEKITSQGFLSERTIKAIQLLTTDRAKEQNTSYLISYYQNIQNYSKELALLKALDKLDNMLWWPNFKIESHQINVISNFVSPMIHHSYPKVEKYLSELVPYVLLDETKEKFARRTVSGANQ